MNSVVNVIQIANIYLFGIDSKAPSVHCKAINGIAVVSHGLRVDRSLHAKLTICLGIKTPH